MLVTSDPCAAYRADGGGRIDVLARGTEKQGFGLVRLTLAPSEPLSAVSRTIVPTTLASAPSCAAATATRIDVFVRGTRSILQHAILRAGQSNLVFEDLGPITSKASATTWGQGRWDVVARGLHGEIEHWWLQE